MKLEEPEEPKWDEEEAEMDDDEVEDKAAEVEEVEIEVAEDAGQEEDGSRCIKVEFGSNKEGREDEEAQERPLDTSIEALLDVSTSPCRSTAVSRI
mmetsp:Transcript_5507/g.10336  ORF Transcript_5507/g.10336 Transcript_5507/m.10336 type:complete len:96 (+) Transcript_5507:3-290(+)